MIQMLAAWDMVHYVSAQSLQLLDRCYKHRGGAADHVYMCLYIMCNQCIILTSSTPQHSQSVYATYEMLNIASQSYFIVLTVSTHDVRNHDRHEWLLNHILSFSQSVHATYETMTDYRQCGARSGSPQ